MNRESLSLGRASEFSTEVYVQCRHPSWLSTPRARPLQPFPAFLGIQNQRVQGTHAVGYPDTSLRRNVSILLWIPF